MSSSILENKENVDVPNEFAKEGKTTSTSSILKASQKEKNVLSEQQLTPQKPPKVTFKDTPVHYHPACYKVELTQSQLDTWEEIRSLDELENWAERTQVVTKEDHQIYLEAASEFLEDIICNLHLIKSQKAQAAKNKSSEQEENSRNKNIEPVENKTEYITSIKEKKSETDIIPAEKMDDGLDIDGAGPLDPAIASLNSLLKAGEDEERAFSPIGSERTSPDCDTMVTSEDIEKLLAKNDFTDDGEIPPLELSHGSKIDAMMDSKFGGKSLEEMTRKLDQLRLMSPAKIDIGINQTDDIDEDSLPVKRRGAKTFPGKEVQAKNSQENTEEKENIPEDDDFTLPVKKREPKAAPKKETVNDDDKEKFKKPMPPKPWKTKKKKIPKDEDSFIGMFPGAGEKAVNGNHDTAIEPSKNDESSFTYVKPQATDNGPLGKSSEGEEMCDKKAMTGQDEAVKQPPSKANENEKENREDASMKDDLFVEQQEDFGLGNDDFKSSSEAFSLELDYLEKFGNNSNLDRLSALARQSLYVKFDPLVKGSPDQDLKQMKADAINSKQTGPANLDDLLLMNTPPHRRTHQTKLAAIKEAQGKDATNLSDVDRLLTFSPQATTSREGSSKQSIEQSKLAEQSKTSDESNDPSLVEPLLYSKSDIAVAVQKEREALLKQTNEESAIRDMEIQEIQSKLQGEVEANAKLRRENDELRTVMNEYERTMAEMIETSEKNKNMSDESKNEIVKERDQLQADLNSVEAAFSDLHRRYEKLKGVLENYKKNEEILKKATVDYQEKLRKSGEKYQMLKKHAEEKIETANIEINRVRRSNDSEMAVMRAALKKEQNKCASLEQAIQQKINENKELTAICDELIQRASGAK